MALFTYGQAKAVTVQNQWLPGRFATVWGVNLNAPAVNPDGIDIEYGKIVGLTQSGLGSNAYTVADVTAQTTSFGVIVRTTDGGIGMEDEWISKPRTNTPLSVYSLTDNNNYIIAVPVLTGHSPAVGGQVYVNHEATTVGSVETADDAGSVALTGWVYASTAYQPTAGSGKAVLIQRTL